MGPVLRWTVSLFFALGCGSELPRDVILAASGPAVAAVEEAPATEVVPAIEEPLRVAVVSDLNGSYGSRRYNEAVHRAVDRIRALAPDLVLSTGDMVAGQRGGLDYEGMWASFHAAVSDRLAAARVPFAVSPGNHDASGYPAFAHERAIFAEAWRERRPELDFLDGERFPLRYSFVRGPALFIALDATTTGPLDDAQMAWLDAQLEAGAHHPVKIVFGHVPLYPFAEGRRADHLGDPALEELLVRRGVSLFLSGHHHAYYPGRRGALRLVSTACLGSGARPLIGTSVPSERSLLLFEVTREGVRELDAYAGPSFERRIERESLPSEVGLPGMRIQRDDLRLFELGEYELGKR